MQPDIDKEDVLRCLRERLATTLERLTAAQWAAQSGAIHSEAKQEHPKDTRSIEAGYLSRGLAERVEAVHEAVTTLDGFALPGRRRDDPIGLGDLIGIGNDEGTETTYFLAPVGGGERLEVNGCEILVLTARAPLGAALVGAHPGDEVVLELSGGKRRLDVVWVR